MSRTQEPASAEAGVLARKDRLTALAAVCVGTMAALVYTSVTGLGDWSQLIVLGGIVLATIGVMIAIDPLRKT